MAPAAVILLLLIAVVVIAAGFLISAVIAGMRVIVRELWRAFAGTPMKQPPRRAAMPPPHVCRNPLCGDNNPAGSVFCRRCGLRLNTTVRKADLYG